MSVNKGKLYQDLALLFVRKHKKRNINFHWEIADRHEALAQFNKLSEKEKGEKIMEMRNRLIRAAKNEKEN